jgi:hypothetical protein
MHIEFWLGNVYFEGRRNGRIASVAGVHVNHVSLANTVKIESHTPVVLHTLEHSSTYHISHIINQLQAAHVSHLIQAYVPCLLVQVQLEGTQYSVG